MEPVTVTTASNAVLGNRQIEESQQSTETPNSVEVRELREQLQQLTAELHDLRSSLSSPPLPDQAQLQSPPLSPSSKSAYFDEHTRRTTSLTSLSANVNGPVSNETVQSTGCNGPTRASVFDLRPPPLPPKPYKAPKKPARTFLHQPSGKSSQPSESYNGYGRDHQWLSVDLPTTVRDRLNGVPQPTSGHPRRMPQIDENKIELQPCDSSIKSDIIICPPSISSPPSSPQPAVGSDEMVPPIPPKSPLLMERRCGPCHRPLFIPPTAPGIIPRPAVTIPPQSPTTRFGTRNCFRDLSPRYPHTTAPHHMTNGNVRQVHELQGSHARSQCQINLNRIDRLNLGSEARSPENVATQLEKSFSTGCCWVKVGPIYLYINPYHDISSPLTLDTPASSPLPVAQIVHNIGSSLFDTETSQAIVLSGESGTGKTYLSCLVLRELFIAFNEKSGLQTDCFRQTDAAVTILRPFVTAQTQTNSSSSQVGILYELHMTDSAIEKAKLHCCFLDHSRVVRQLAGEMDYHIFYQVINGLSQEERLKFHLSGDSASRKLKRSTTWGTQGRCYDRQQFLKWKNALNRLGIPISDILRVIAAIILLTDIHFVRKDANSVEPDDSKKLASIAALLGLTATALQDGLSSTSKVVKGQSVTNVRDPDSANLVRNNLAKTLYHRCVSAIVRRVNTMKATAVATSEHSVSPIDPNPASPSGLSTSSDESSVQDSGIGMASCDSKGAQKTRPDSSQDSSLRADGTVYVLDMPGFSTGINNTFETLCRNMASERQQSFFVSKVFTVTKQMMHSEGIKCQMEMIIDREQPSLDLIVHPRTGILNTLNEQSLLSDGSTSRFLASLRELRKQSAILELPENKSNDTTFTVRHYLDTPVVYDAVEFVDTNRDELSIDLIRLFDRQSCNFGFLSYLFGPDLKALEENDKVRTARATSCTVDMSLPSASSVPFAQGFTSQVDRFLDVISTSNTTFIHCIRPNQRAEYHSFSNSCVLDQIQRLDIVPMTQVLTSGLPYCLKISEFNERYRFLALMYHRHLPDKPSPYADETKLILECFLKAVDESNMPYVSNPWALGSQHIFFSEGAHEQLDTLKQASQKGVGRVQSPGPQVSNVHQWLQQQQLDETTRGPKSPVKSLCSRDGPLVSLPGGIPPPLPSARRYTVEGKRKVAFPQERIMVKDFPHPQTGPVRLLNGQRVTAVGLSSRPGHVLISCGNQEPISVPHHFTKVVASPNQ